MTSPLRFATIPTKPGYIHIQQSRRASFAIDGMSAEEMRRVLKLILSGQAVQQPHGGIRADGLALHREHAPTNPGDLKWQCRSGTGQSCPETGGQHQRSVDAIDPPQGQQFSTNGFRGIATSGGAGRTQEQVGAVRALGEKDIPVFEIRILLNLEGRFIGKR